jgi:DNA-directed RNA polymerase subunit beta'
MTRRVQIVDSGNSTWLPGAMVDVKVFNDTNAELEENGQNAADGRAQLMGITKASLATDSWLSAASFQETTRVLTEAAIDGKHDNLVGLKENIIIGKLIPAGSGLDYYAKDQMAVEFPEGVQLEAWARLSNEDPDLLTYGDEEAASGGVALLTAEVEASYDGEDTAEAL